MLINLRSEFPQFFDETGERRHSPTCEEEGEGEDLYSLHHTEK
jgi:hypothetical protein